MSFPGAERWGSADEAGGRLLFMTYNGWVMLAVAVGAAVGHLIFGGDAEKSVACH